MPKLIRKRFQRQQLQRATSYIFANRNNIITLIRYYRGNECLWNPQNEDYNDAVKKRMIWDWIAKQFGEAISTQKVQNLIRLLQEQAMREWQAEKEAVVLRIDFVPEFDYYEEFDFLKSLEQLEAEEFSEDDCDDVTLATTSNTKMPVYFHTNSVKQPSIRSSKIGSIEKISTSTQADTFCAGIHNILSTLPLHVFAKTQAEILKILQNARAELQTSCSSSFKRKVLYARK